MSTSSTSPVGSTISGLSMEGAGVFVVQSISFAYLFYMSLCTFWSLFKVSPPACLADVTHPREGVAACVPMY